MQLTAWMKVHERNYVWLGLTNKRKEGTFEWSSGRQTSFNVTKYWNSGQSNSSFDCAYIFQGKLGTYKCSTSGLHFMCQKRHWAGKEEKDEDYKITSRKRGSPRNTNAREIDFPGRAIASSWNNLPSFWYLSEGFDLPHIFPFEYLRNCIKECICGRALALACSFRPSAVGPSLARARPHHKPLGA